MDAEKQLRRMAKLGITDFETVEDVGRMQKDMLRRLKRSSVDPDRYAGLADCRSDFCGQVNCLEGCCFGTYRRRLAAIPAIHDLLQKCNPPLYEVRIGRGVWVRPFGKLQEASTEAAKQLNRRALDTLYDYRIAAVGAFKVAPAVPPLDDDERWRCEIHQHRGRSKKGGFGTNFFHATRPWRDPQYPRAGSESSESNRARQAWSDHQRSAQAGSQGVAASLAR